MGHANLQKRNIKDMHDSKRTLLPLGFFAVLCTFPCLQFVKTTNVWKRGGLSSISGLVLYVCAGRHIAKGHSRYSTVIQCELCSNWVGVQTRSAFKACYKCVLIMTTFPLKSQSVSHQSTGLRVMTVS